MFIKSVHIENFKSFKSIDIDFTGGINILVGDNEAGKSTILEAIHLALTGIYNGRYLKNELSQYLFNIDVLNDYFTKVNQYQKAELPHILIEIFFNDDSYPKFIGNYNYLKQDKECGISYRIEFNEEYNSAYKELIQREREIKTLPIEYYKISWSSFSRDYHITSRQIPLKPAFIDSSSHRYSNGADMFISRIITRMLEDKEIVDISQSYRKLQEIFMSDPSIDAINQRIKSESNISDKELNLSVDFSSSNAWAELLTTYFDNIPFCNIGKGEQCVIKTKLALTNKTTEATSVILMEEPENHLSHSNLNKFIRSIQDNYQGKQIILSTHSSFVANKLGLKNLILLSNKKCIRLSDLSSDTTEYFEKLAGYDTLRLILCKKAILVEGASDDLIVQKAYFAKKRHLPIEDNIDVICVGNLSFLRFLEIAKLLTLNVSVITDNDGDIEALRRKYGEYLTLPNIKISYDTQVDTGGIENFNYNTLEPKILKANNLETLNRIFGKDYTTHEKLLKYMKQHKTDCALSIFNYPGTDFVFPQYIIDSFDE